MMTFSYDGKAYAIEFSRDHKRVEAINKLTGHRKIVESRYPYTTVEILEIDPEQNDTRMWTLYDRAEVGCLPPDRFTLEGGRLLALRKVGNKMPKEMRRAMWTSYMNRPRAPKVNIGELLEENRRLKESLKAAVQSLEKEE